MRDLAWSGRSELEPGRNHLVMASYPPLTRITFTVRFFRAVAAVRKQPAGAEGLMGYSLRALPLSRRYWTLSVWADPVVESRARWAGEAAPARVLPELLGAVPARLVPDPEEHSTAPVHALDHGFAEVKGAQRLGLAEVRQ